MKSGKKAAGHCAGGKPALHSKILVTPLLKAVTSTRHGDRAFDSVTLRPDVHPMALQTNGDEQFTSVVNAASASHFICLSVY